MMTIDVVNEKLGQFMTTEYLVGYPLTSISAWQRRIKLLASDNIANNRSICYN